MDREATLDLLNALEHDAPVDEWSIDGIAVWPIVRAEVWWAANADYARVRTTVHSDSTVARRLRQLRDQPREMARVAARQLTDPDTRRLKRQRVSTIVLGDAVSRILVDGRWLDRHTDPFVDVVESVGEQTLQLDPYYLEHDEPLYRPALRIQPVADALWLTSRLARRNVPRNLPGQDRVLRRLRENGVGTDAVSTRALERQVAYVRGMAGWFDRLIGRTGARLGVVVDQGPVQMAFNLAFARRGLRSVELQHGLQTGNARYARWDRVPPQGYALAPSHYWCWTQHDVDEIASWSGHTTRHTPLLGGNLWLDAWLQGTAPSLLEVDDAIRNVVENEPREREILVTLSRGFDGEQHLAPLRHAIGETHDRYRWWVRPHPAMTPGEADAAMAALGAADGRPETRLARDLPLYGLLRNVDLHVTHVSSAVVEARAFGVPSILLDREAMALFPEEAEEGWARAAATPGELVGLAGALGEWAPARASTPSRESASSLVRALLS